MLRVYLDQNKWIDLARAAHGRPDGARFVDALDAARAAVEAGRARFVLCGARYMENLQRRDLESRTRLGRVMIELSRFETLAPPSVIVPAELDQALHAEFGRPVDPTFPAIFGFGAAHAFGQSSLAYTTPPEAATLPPNVRAAFEREATIMSETAALIGPPDNFMPEVRDVIQARPFSREYAAAENELSQRLAAQGYGRGERLTDAVTATVLRDIREPLYDALRRAPVTEDEFFALGREGFKRLIGRLPSRRVTVEMRRARHANPQKRWEPNDLNDVSALAIAVPYCDVVVTERSWVHVLTTAGADRTNDTILISDVAQIPELLG